MVRPWTANCRGKMSDEGYYLAKHHASSGVGIPQIARFLHTTYKTVCYWLRSDKPPSCVIKNKSKLPRRSKHPATVKRRRELVAKLLRQRITVEGFRLTPVRRKKVSRQIVKQPFSSPASIARALSVKYNISVCPTTVRSDLISLGLVAKVRRKGPFLTAAHMTARVAFCKRMRLLGSSLVFSDECFLDDNESCGRMWQWCRSGEEPETRKKDQGAFSICVWACIGIGFRHMIILRREALDRDKYQKKILLPSLKLLQEQSQLGHVFQQDNCRVHCGSVAWLRRKHVQAMDDWPAKSPDLNVIETVWAWLRQDVAARGPYGEAQLEQFVKEAFYGYQQERLDALVAGFSERCARCEAAKGRTVKAPRKAQVAR